MTLRVTLTGVLSLETEGYFVDESALGGGQWRVACAFIASERHRAIERDELAEILWPDKLPSSWEPSLRTIVSKVRRFFTRAGLDATDVLTHAFGCYQLHLPAGTMIDTEELTRDVEAAEAAIGSKDFDEACRLAELAAAVASRPFLAGTDAPWAERKRDELRSWRVRALEALAEGRIATGDAAPAVVAASGVLSLEPFRETAHRMLMRAHGDMGNRAEALRTYERCRQLISEELGVDPAPETEALYLELLRKEHTPAERPVADRPDRADPTVPRLFETRSSDPFVGRTEERSVLADVWSAAKAGRLTLVLIEGEPGIGKTRLAAETANTASADGAMVLYGRPAEEMGVPFLPFVEALGQFIARCPAGDLERGLGPLAGELTRLLPSLRHRLPALPEPVSAEAETERYRLFEAVTGWLVAASELSPLLLILDDLHWADRPTIQLLRHLLRAGEPMRVCVLGAYRGVDLVERHPLADLLAQLRETSGIERIPLGGLSAREVAALLGTEDKEGSAPVAAWVHAQTNGNPFFAGALAHHLVESGVVERAAERWAVLRSLDDSGVPNEVRQLISWRISRLPAPCHDVLAIASVLGVEFDVALLARLSDRSEDVVLDAIDEARRAGLVTDAPGGRDRAAFVHALVRAAVYDELSGPRRMRLHLRAARALEPLPDPEKRLAELAHHYAEAAPLGESDRAVRYAMLAGTRSREALAFEQAAAHYERALAILDIAEERDTERRCDIEIALGETLHRSGDPRHRDVLLEAAEHARAFGDHERLGRVGLALNKMGSPSSAGAEDLVIVEMLDEALDGMPPQDGELRARLMATLAAELVWRPDMGRRRELGDGAKAMARRLRPDVLAAVMYPAHFATSGPDNLDERLAEAKELIQISEHIGDREQVCRGHMIRVDALVEAGDIQAADDAIATAERLIEELRQPFMTWEVVMRRAGRELLAGRLADVEKLVQAAYELGVERNVPPSLLTAVYGSQLLMLRFEQGRLDELTPLISSVADLSPTFGPAILSFAYAETDRMDDARPHFEQAAGTAVRADHDIQWLAQMVMLAQVCSALEDAPAARSLRAVLADYAGRMSWVTSVACGPTDLGLGLLAATDGDLLAAHKYFAAAIDLCEHMGAEGWLARTRCEWARLLTVSGDASDADRARDLAEAAARSADRNGQARVSERARSELAVLSS